MKQYRVFGQNRERGGNLMAIVDRPINPADAHLPVTVLIEESAVADVKFRFFYPGSLEAPICGHALLGAAYSLDTSTVTVETGARLCHVRKTETGCMVNFGPRTSIPPTFDETPRADWFDLAAEQLHVRGIHSASKPKLMIEVDSLTTLGNVRFDLEALRDWNQGKNFSGYTVYTQTGADYYARASNPLYNIPEDAACAVCCAALPIAQSTRTTVRMGFPDYPNALSVETIEGEVWIGGNVYPAANQ